MHDVPQGEQWVENPLAHVVLKKAAALDLTYTPAANVTALQGKGVEATLDGRRFWIGSHR